MRARADDHQRRDRRLPRGCDQPWATSGGSSLKTHVTLPGGATVVISSTTREWAYAGILGHTIATGGGTSTGGLRLFDPYGQPLDPTTRSLGTATADDAHRTAERSGWHQGAAKLPHTARDVTAVEMGARLYIPALARFLKVDPIEGGVDSDYAWPTDPIQDSDLSGKMSDSCPSCSYNRYIGPWAAMSAAEKAAHAETGMMLISLLSLPVGGLAGTAVGRGAAIARGGLAPVINGRQAKQPCGAPTRSGAKFVFQSMVA